MNITYTVYRLISPSNKSYVGWTSRKLKKRLQDHCSEVRRGFQRPIQRALRKYPLEQWTQQILFEGVDYGVSLEAEKANIALFDTINPQKGYNISIGGEYGALGVVRTDANKKAIREGKRKNPWKATPEQRQKISDGLKGHPPSDKQKAAVKLARAKHYRVTEPSGKVVNVFSLNEYCKQNGLDQGNLCRVALGWTKQSKGYKAELHA